VVKMDSDFDVFFSQYIGASQQQMAKSVAVDGDDNIYVFGDEQNLNPNPWGANLPTFSPITDGVIQQNPLMSDTWIVKISPSGIFQWCTYFGSLWQNQASDIGIDGLGRVILLGRTHGDESLPTNNHLPFPNQQPLGAYIEDSYKNSAALRWEGFVSMLSSGGELLYTTYYGGKHNEWMEALTITPSNHLYVAGYSSTLNGLNVFDNEPELKIQCVDFNEVDDTDVFFSEYSSAELGVFENWSSISPQAFGFRMDLNALDFNVLVSEVGFSRFDVLVYPNPTSQGVVSVSSDREIATITLFDVMGKTLLTSRPNSNHAYVDVRGLADGLYLIKIVRDGQAVTKKLIVK
jgi:hypothetical protein